MKNLVLPIILLAAIPFATAHAESVAEPAAAELYKALEKAGAQPLGPSSVSQTIQITNLTCSGGFNEMLHRSTVDCDFTQGDKDIQVSGKTANNVLAALFKAKLIKQGPGEISGGSIKSLECTMSNFDGAKTFRCEAEK